MMSVFIKSCREIIRIRVFMKPTLQSEVLQIKCYKINLEHIGTNHSRRELNYRD